MTAFPPSYLQEIIIHSEGLDGHNMVVDLESNGGRVPLLLLPDGRAALGSGVHVHGVPWRGRVRRGDNEMGNRKGGEEVNKRLDKTNHQSRLC